MACVPGPRAQAMNLLSSFSGSFSFGDILVDVDAHTVQRGQDACVLEPKAFRVLLELLSRPGDVITKDELLDNVWGHRAVTPNVLSRAITQIRHAIGDSAQHPRYIEDQLKQFNRRERTNDNAIMHTIASKLTELEAHAVAEYVATME